MAPSSATSDFHSGLPRTRSWAISGSALITSPGISGPVVKSMARCQLVMATSSTRTGRPSTSLAPAGEAGHGPRREHPAPGAVTLFEQPEGDLGARQRPLRELVRRGLVRIGDGLGVRHGDAHEDVCECGEVALDDLALRCRRHLGEVGQLTRLGHFAEVRALRLERAVDAVLEGRVLDDTGLLDEREQCGARAGRIERLQGVLGLALCRRGPGRHGDDGEHGQQHDAQASGQRKHLLLWLVAIESRTQVGPGVGSAASRGQWLSSAAGSESMRVPRGANASR